MKLIFSVLDRHDLWPHFRKHYEAQGVTQFLCVTYGPRLDGVTHIPATIPPESFSGIHDAQFHNNVLDMYVRPSEWCVVADLDEFIVVPDMTLREAASCAQREGANYVRGQFYDRLTADGSLPAELDDDIWTQFPLSTNVTQVIARGCVEKVTIIRGDTRVAGGHHALATTPVYPWKTMSKVYHFKWWGNDDNFFLTRWHNARESAHPYAHEKEDTVEHLHTHKNCIDLSKLQILETQDG